MALIDHYDSFSFNVIDWLARQDLPGDPGLEVLRIPYDNEAAMGKLRRSPLPLVLSPGPKRPEDAVPTLALVHELLGRVPILGVCLGQQILAVATGGEVVRGAAPMHGTTRRIQVEAAPGLLRGLTHFQAATYNSLVVRPDSLHPSWQVNAYCELGEVQAISRELAGKAPAYGLQFHPESFMSEQGSAIRRNWVRIVWKGA